MSLRALLAAAARVPPPHLVLGALCVGLGAATVVRGSHPVLGLLAAVLGLAALVVGAARALLLAAALLVAGAWWGSARLEMLDHSFLAQEIGRAAAARVEVTGPARRSEFAVRVPVRVLRFGRVDLRESARLDLPAERAPPQGALLEVVATVERPANRRRPAASTRPATCGARGFTSSSRPTPSGSWAGAAGSSAPSTACARRSRGP